MVGVQRERSDGDEQREGHLEAWRDDVYDHNGAALQQAARHLVRRPPEVPVLIILEEGAKKELTLRRVELCAEAHGARAAVAKSHAEDGAHGHLLCARLSPDPPPAQHRILLPICAVFLVGAQPFLVWDLLLKAQLPVRDVECLSAAPWIADLLTIVPPLECAEHCEREAEHYQGHVEPCERSENFPRPLEALDAPVRFEPVLRLPITGDVLVHRNLLAVE
mmetsp:Transcript_4731/g.16330  ORF Transcript_4731/g.16330 Transcript_4731/m.16330 type:complete len:221 (+) Transcript_4731:1676-2338(+)